MIHVYRDHIHKSYILNRTNNTTVICFEIIVYFLCKSVAWCESVFGFAPISVRDRDLIKNRDQPTHGIAQYVLSVYHNMYLYCNQRSHASQEYIVGPLPLNELKHECERLVLVIRKCRATGSFISTTLKWSSLPHISYLDELFLYSEAAIYTKTIRLSTSSFTFTF